MQAATYQIHMGQPVAQVPHQLADGACKWGRPNSRQVTEAVVVGAFGHKVDASTSTAHICKNRGFVVVALLPATAITAAANHQRSSIGG